MLDQEPKFMKLLFCFYVWCLAVLMRSWWGYSDSSPTHVRAIAPCRFWPWGPWGFLSPFDTYGLVSLSLSFILCAPQWSGVLLGLGSLHGLVRAPTVQIRRVGEASDDPHRRWLEWGFTTLMCRKAPSEMLGRVTLVLQDEGTANWPPWTADFPLSGKTVPTCLKGPQLPPLNLLARGQSQGGPCSSIPTVALHIWKWPFPPA